MSMNRRTTRATSWLLCVLLLGGAFLHSLHHCLEPVEDALPLFTELTTQTLDGIDHGNHLEVKCSDFCCPVCAGAFSLYSEAVEPFRLTVTGVAPLQPVVLSAISIELPQSNLARGPPAA